MWKGHTRPCARTKPKNKAKAKEAKGPETP